MKQQIKWSKDKIDLIKKEYPLGDKKELCKTFECSYSQLKDIARRYKIKSLKDQKLYKLQWLMADDLEVFYWLGFILADGTFSQKRQLVISLNIKDFEHLNFLAKKLKYDLKIEEYKTVYGDGIKCILRCDDSYNVPLILKKLNLGTTAPKTYNPPTSLDFLKTNEQFFALFCGLVDGDGTIEWRNNKKSIVPRTLKINCHKSWKIFYDEIKSKFEKINFVSNTKIDCRGHSLFYMSKKEQILFLRYFAEENKIPIMKRKWYQEIS